MWQAPPHALTDFEGQAQSQVQANHGEVERHRLGARRLMDGPGAKGVRRMGSAGNERQGVAEARQGAACSSMPHQGCAQATAHMLKGLLHTTIGMHEHASTALPISSCASPTSSPCAYLRRLSMMNVPEVRVATPTTIQRISSMGKMQTKEMGMKAASA